MAELLEGRNAIIYGGGGGIGGGVARALAGHGARVFLVGRTRETLRAVADEIGNAGGSAEIAVLDALDEGAVAKHVDELGPHGVRVCGIWTAGVVETLSPGKLTSVGGEDAPAPRSAEEMIAGMLAMRRAPRLADVTELAAFLASDRASGITGTMVNATCGLVLR